MNKIYLVDVNIINNKLNQSFTYMIDSILYNKIAYGDIVLVEFNRKLEPAIINYKKIETSKPSFKLNEVVKILKNNRISKEQEEIIEYLNSKIYASKEEIVNLVMNKNEIFNTKLMIKIKNYKEEIKEIKEKYFDKEEIPYKKIEKEDRSVIKNYILNDDIDIYLDKSTKYLKVFKYQGEEVYEKKDFLIKYAISDYKFNKEKKEGKINSELIEEYKYKGLEKKVKEKIELSEYQKEKLSLIQKNIEEKPILLHGITGSGKTSIFIKLIEEKLKENKKVLILVPEITLVAQMSNDIKRYFGDICGVFNNSLNKKQKTNFVKGVENNNYKIIISTRSGIFLNIKSLGLVIIDEEHDSSYKQNFHPYYHVDDMLEFWKKKNINVLYASATPRLLTYTKAQKDLFYLVEMNKRYNDYSQAKIIFKDFERDKLINENFLKEIKKTIDNQNNILILFNVKGYAGSIECLNCGNVELCPNCHMPLKYYKTGSKASCNYCDYEIKNYNSCTKCGENKISLIGMGIEKVQEEIEKKLKVKILRIDSKVAKTKEKVNKIIKEFNESKGKVLLGTQIIAKGLNFENLNKVMVLNLDNMLYFNDFNSHEKAYQLLEQVSGRSGRKKEDGEVLIYTNHKEDIIYKAVYNHDYKMFYKEEMLNRKLQKSLPYYFIAQIEFRAKNVYAYEEEILKLKENLEKEGLLVTKIVQPYLSEIGEEKRLKLFIKYKKENIKKIISENIDSVNIPKNKVLIDLNIENYGL